MNEKLFDERESELPEVFIFENYYQVNLKRGKLFTPGRDLYPTLDIAEFKASSYAPGFMEGFYNAVEGTIVKNPEALSALPDNTYLVRLPEPRKLDAEGYARLHEDPGVFDYLNQEQKWDCYAAIIMSREETLTLFNQLKESKEMDAALSQRTAGPGENNLQQVQGATEKTEKLPSKGIKQVQAVKKMRRRL